MLYYLSTFVYLTAFYLPIPASLAPFADVLEFLPRWLVFLPLLFYIARKLALKTYVIFSVLTLINFLLVVDFNLGLNRTSPIPEKSAMLRIASYNVGGVDDYKALANWFESAQLDVLLLQETDSTALNKALETLRLDSHCAASLCIVTKGSLTFTDSLSRRQFGGWGNFAARYDLFIADQHFKVVNVHLDTPRNGLNSLMNNQNDRISVFLRHYKKRETESLMASMLLSEETPNVIVAGDFNLTEQSVLYRRFWGRWQNTFSKAGFGVGHTKTTRLLGARIDHILTSANIAVLSSEVAAGLGGDHKPVFSQIMSVQRQGNTMRVSSVADY